jgi:hypothetical protein
MQCGQRSLLSILHRHCEFLRGQIAQRAVRTEVGFDGLFDLRLPPRSHCYAAEAKVSCIGSFAFAATELARQRLEPEMETAPGTIAKEISTLKHALRLAIEWGELHQNAAQR